MANYIFKTTATMKEYNNKKWWIDPDAIKEIHITASNLSEALEHYRAIVKNNYFVEISNNAMKNKSPMYVGEGKQVGYVITGKTEFEDSEARKWSAQFIDLWVTVLTVVETEFN